MYKLIATAVVAIAMTGCASVDRANLFSINEDTLQDVARDQLAQAMQERGGLDIGNAGLVELNLVLNDLDLDLIAADGGAVLAGFDSTLNSTLPIIGTVKTRLNPKIQAGLELRDQAIYIVNPKILSLGVGDSVDRQLQALIGANDDALGRALAGYLEQQPIYRLDDSAETRLASRFLSTVRIGDDRISLMP